MKGDIIFPVDNLGASSSLAMSRFHGFQRSFPFSLSGIQNFFLLNLPECSQSKRGRVRLQTSCNCVSKLSTSCFQYACLLLQSSLLGVAKTSLLPSSNICFTVLTGCKMFSLSLLRHTPNPISTSHSLPQAAGGGGEKASTLPFLILRGAADGPLLAF